MLFLSRVNFFEPCLLFRSWEYWIPYFWAFLVSKCICFAMISFGILSFEITGFLLMCTFLLKATSAFGKMWGFLSLGAAHRDLVRDGDRHHLLQSVSQPDGCGRVPPGLFLSHRYGSLRQDSKLDQQLELLHKNQVCLLFSRNFCIIEINAFKGVLVRLL